MNVYDIIMENTDGFYYEVYFCVSGTTKAVDVKGAIAGGTISFSNVAFGTYDFALNIYIDSEKHTLLYENIQENIAVAEETNTVTFPDRNLSDFSRWFLVNSESELRSAIASIASRTDITEEKKAKICLLGDISCQTYDALVSDVSEKIEIEYNGHILDTTIPLQESIPDDPDPESIPTDPDPSSEPEIPDGYTGVRLTSESDFDAMRTDGTLVSDKSYYFWGDATLTDDKLTEFQKKILRVANINTTYGNGNITFGPSIVDFSYATGVTTLGDEWFYNSLIKIILPPNIDSSIAGQIFERTKSLVAIVISDENENFCTVDGVLYSKDMTKLYKYPAAKSGDSFTLPDTVTSLAYGAFEHNKNLVSISGLGQIASIDGMCAFSSCTSLKSADFTGSSLTSLPAYTFENSTALEKVILPSGLTSIGGNSFVGCSSLKEVHLGPTPPSLIVYNGYKEFYGCSSAIQFYVPTSRNSAYVDSDFMATDKNAYPSSDRLVEE
ncbi:MAG: leucine-rich repeat domain-containing protein [Treponema sp.]|nr:leucine-rich repeat domain-containing protein [Treponema sp.]